MKDWRKHKILITPLTPIHIGDGSQLEAYEYVVKDGVFTKIDLPRFIKRLSAEDQLAISEYLGSSDLTAFRRFVAGRVSSEDAEYVARVSARVQDLVRQKLADPRNQLLVSPFVRSLGSPYLPGSSIKGAIRTALLHALQEKSGMVPPGRGQSRGGEGTQFEAQLLGYARPSGSPDVAGDPLKGLRVADVPLSPEDIVVDQVETWRVSDTGPGPLSLQSLSELTWSVYTAERGDDTSRAFEGEIRVYPEWLKKGPPAESSHGRAWLEVWEEGLAGLAKACNAFYLDKVLRGEFESVRELPALRRTYEHLKADAQQAAAERGFLLRLGWGSGRDSMSLNLTLSRLPRPRTRKLVSEGRVPLGWAIAWWGYEEPDGDALSD